MLTYPFPQVKNSIGIVIWCFWDTEIRFLNIGLSTEQHNLSHGATAARD